MPGSLPSSSIRYWTGPSNKSEPRNAQAAAGEWAEPALRQDGHLLGRIGQRTDDEVLQRLDVLGVDDPAIDGDRYPFAAALDGDLHQAAAGLAVHLGVSQLFLRFHQLLLH